MMRPKKNCIFCDAPSVSKEHFWPEWLSPYLPKQDRPSRIGQFFQAERKEPVRIVRQSERPGHTHDRTIRAVCADCNNGWMSGLEERVKPAILGVLQGQTSILTPVTSHAVALWVAVKSVVAEHSTDDAILTPFDDRLALRHGEIPDWLRIFVSLHSCKTQAAFYRHSTTLAFSPIGPEPPLPPGTARNVSTTSFLVGTLFFYVSCSRLVGFEHSLLDPPVPMSRLWPPVSEMINLAAWPALSTPEITRSSQTLERMVTSPLVKLPGPERSKATT